MAFRDDLIFRAIEQWKWFGKDLERKGKYIGPDGRTTLDSRTGGHSNPPKETVEPYASRIADYWLAIPTKDYDNLVRRFAKDKGRLDGTVDLPWSAAFISYCMQIAGAGSTAFPYAAGHATWIVKSIRNRQEKKLKANLVGYRPGEQPLLPGDLIGRSRTEGVTYDNAVQKGWFESHSDIVVEVNSAQREAFVIGGNVGQSVSKCKVKITAEGMLDDPYGWIVHIRNNIEFPATAMVAALDLAEYQVG